MSDITCPACQVTQKDYGYCSKCNFPTSVDYETFVFPVGDSGTASMLACIQMIIGEIRPTNTGEVYDLTHYGLTAFTQPDGWWVRLTLVKKHYPKLPVVYQRRWKYLLTPDSE